jgi:hypothetical protein
MCSDSTFETETETETETPLLPDIKKHNSNAAYERFEEDAKAAFAPYLQMFVELP